MRVFDWGIIVVALTILIMCLSSAWRWPFEKASAPLSEITSAALLGDQDGSNQNIVSIKTATKRR
jgi:hypothetical protein